MTRREVLRKKHLRISLVLHAVAVFALALATMPRASDPRLYHAVEIRLTQASLAAEATPARELVVESPREAAPMEAEREPVPADDAEELKPRPEGQEKESPAPEAADGERNPLAAVEVDEEERDASDEIDVRLQGLAEADPAYSANLIRQMDRCFRRFRPSGAGSREVAVLFEVDRTGATSGARLERRSGSRVLDMAALAAVECLGSGRLGPLPEDYGWDILPVHFTLKPERSGS